MDGGETHDELLIAGESVPPQAGVSDHALYHKYRSASLSFEARNVAPQNRSAARGPRAEAPAFRLHPAGGKAADGRDSGRTGARTRRPCEHRGASLFRPHMNDQRQPDPRTLAAAIRAGDRRALARAITLIESSRDDHRRTAEALLEAALPARGSSIRIGVSGVPGVGKSTFIEALG